MVLCSFLRGALFRMRNADADSAPAITKDRWLHECVYHTKSLSCHARSNVVTALKLLGQGLSKVSKLCLISCHTGLYCTHRPHRTAGGYGQLHLTPN